MAIKKSGPNPDLVKVSASCLAAVVTAGPKASLISILRPYKHHKRGQGFARSVYYRPALIAIRQYHAAGNDPNIFKTARFELQKKHDVSEKQWERTKCLANIRAIEVYEKRYGNRHFVVQKNHRLSFKLGPIVITAKPDLWVTEAGNTVLLKIGLAKMKRDFIDILLTVIRKAAVASGYRVRAKNIVYLDITHSVELICNRSLTRFNLTFRSVANRIAREWPKVDSGYEPGPSSGPETQLHT
jgi:hypothetical protein